MEFFAATCHRRWEYLRIQECYWEIALYTDRWASSWIRKIRLALWPTGSAAPGELPGSVFNFKRLKLFRTQNFQLTLSSNNTYLQISFYNHNKRLVIP